MFEYASTAEQRGLEVIIAGAGGAAHLPGMCASKTALPWINCPSSSLPNNNNNAFGGNYPALAFATGMPVNQYYGISGAVPFGTFTKPFPLPAFCFTVTVNVWFCSTSFVALGAIAIGTP